MTRWFVFTVLLLALVLTADAKALRIPHPGNRAPVILRHQLQLEREGCFHVAAREFVCPLPAPRAR